MVDPITSLLFVGYLAAAPISTRNPNYFSLQKVDSIGDVWNDLATEYTITNNDRLVTASLISPQSTRLIPFDRINFIKNELDTYRYLENGWDGEDSLKPSDESITRAKVFLDKLPSGLPTPKPMISKKGEIGFYWNNESFYADLHLETDNKVSYYARKKIGNFPEIFHDDLPEHSISTDWFKNNAIELYLA
jgi:hypothetical protein